MLQSNKQSAYKPGDLNYCKKDKIKKDINPFIDTLKIILFYIILGSSWILISDRIIYIFTDDVEVIKQLQLYKGWIYVAITGLLFFYIIYYRIKLYKKAVDVINKNYDELCLKQKALKESEEKYQLVVDASKDGIWEWNLKTNEYFSSIIYKMEFGYSKDDFPNTLEAWQSLVHEKDQRKAIVDIRKYLSRKVEYYESEYRIKAKDGSYRWILSKGKAVWDKDGNPFKIAGSHTDITERKNLEERLHYLAYYDQLTSLPNRVHLEEKVKDIINNKKHEKLAFIYLDIDNFKHINDTMGHAIGDKLLKHIANILISKVHDSDFVARLSGDEFAIILLDVHSNEEIKATINNILEELRNTWIVENQVFYVAVSMGIALYPEHGSNLSALMQNADTAMFNAKDKGRDGFAFFTSDMREKAWNYVQLSNKLRRALVNNEFLLYYQPQIDLAENKITGVEALIRWKIPDNGIVNPQDFIPFAEQTGQIFYIDDWVFKQACLQKKKWFEKGKKDIKMFINLSSKRLNQQNLIENIKDVIRECGLNCSGVTIEITETAAMTDLDRAIYVLNELKKLGISIALDDFGTGYSSLTYLKELPIDILKIDKGFIKNIVNSKNDGYIFKSLVYLAHHMGLKVVAEGVETKEQLSFIKSCGCDFAQGFYFSKPLPQDEVEAVFESVLPV